MQVCNFDNLRVYAHVCVTYTYLHHDVLVVSKCFLFQCVKVKRYRDTMINLCRNRIPLCIEVLLCPNCELQSEKETTPQGTVHDVKDTHSNSYVLLEQWTIQEVRVRWVTVFRPLPDLAISCDNR